MKKGKKITLITAGCMVLAGLILAAAGLAAVQFDISSFNTVTYATTHYEIEEEFHHISIAGSASDVRLYPSEYDTCRVVCAENKNATFEVTVEDDTLYIRRQDNSVWQLQFGVFLGETGITVYLPEDTYESLVIRTASGDITVPEAIQFASVDVQSISGEITLLALVSGEQSVSSQSGDIRIGNTSPESLTVQSGSGEITLEKVSDRTEIQLKASSGDVTFTDVKGQTIAVSTSSGEITFSRVIAAGNMRLESVSGDIALRDSDAEALCIQTGSGDVSGTLRSEKIFRIETKSGDVNVPYSASGGKCDVTTTSGDVDFAIVPAVS